jgi:hypothetical protein
MIVRTHDRSERVNDPLACHGADGMRLAPQSGSERALSLERSARTIKERNDE